MDPILFAFAVVAATVAAEAARAWWRGRRWAAALLAVLAAVAVTPLTVGLSAPVIVAGLLLLTGVVGWLCWPRPLRHREGDDLEPDGDRAPGGPGAGRDRGGQS